MSDVCSSDEIARDSLCSMNLTHHVCTQLSNPWDFICSQSPKNSFVTPTNQLGKAMISSGLSSWQIGLISGSSVAFLLCLLLLFVYFYRRCRHTKRLALSEINLYNNVKPIEKNGIPRGQAFQRVATILQPKRVNHHTAVSWLQDDLNRRNSRVSKLYNQITLVECRKIHDSTSPSNTFRMSKIPVIIPPSPSNLTESTILSDSVSKISSNDNNKSTNSSDPSILINPNTSTSKYFINLSYIDDNLTDEDAWMSILDVVNAELAILDNEEKTGTSM